MNAPELRLPPELAKHVTPDQADALLAALAVELDEYVAEQAMRAVHATLCANFGPAMGDALFADLTGRADASNAKLVPGVTRSAVSKASARLRRGFGLPVRYPLMARKGRKPKGAATPEKQTD